MTISEIYTKYNIPQNLREHMYRVTAVGLAVADMLDNSIILDRDILTTTMLLHDMGNIIKFDFRRNNLNFPNQDIETLKKTKQEFIAKYGGEEHLATQSIAKELGVPDKVIDVLNNIGSSKVFLTLESDDWYRKISSYADLRVAPYGVVSVNQRFDDLVKRYEGGNHALANIEDVNNRRKGALLLEKQLQEKASTPLDSITTETIELRVRKLQEFVV